ncbi:protein, SNF2 family [Trichuris suis]|nr:protein, SNF2 family [Trichuris suis]
MTQPDEEEADSSTRIEKLVALLKSKSPVLRELAVSNLSTACVRHPTVLNTLLTRVQQLLMNRSYGSRVSAAQAIGELCKACLHDEHKDCNAPMVSQSFELNFDLSNTLECNEVMLCCDGNEFDALPQERQEQYQMLGQQLADKYAMIFDIKTLVSESDLICSQEGTSTDDPQTKKRKKQLQFNLSNLDIPSDSFVGVVSKFCFSLSSSLYSASWFVRHGAALALKELLPVVHCENLRLFLLEHMLSVLALDRFSDFIGNHVFAPVREACAQGVGAVTPFLSTELQHRLYDIVISFLKFNSPGKDDWACPFSGLLVAKYMLQAVYNHLDRPAVPANFVWAVVDCLENENEDVVIAASEAVSGVVEKLLDALPDLADDLYHRCEKRLSMHCSDNTDASVKGLLHILDSCSMFTVSLDSLVVCLNLLDHSMSDIRSLYLSLIIKSLKSVSLESEKMVTYLSLFMPRLFINNLVETESINTDPTVLVEFVHQMLGYWLATLMVPWSNPVLTKEFLGANSPLFVGGEGVMAASDLERQETVLQAKVAAARLLVLLFKVISRAENANSVVSSGLFSLLLFHLISSSLERRVAVCIVLCEWLKMDTEFCNFCDETLKSKVLENVEASPFIYDETFFKLTELNLMCTKLTDLVNGKSHGVSDVQKMSCHSEADQSSTVATLNPDEAVNTCRMLKQVFSSGTAAASLDVAECFALESQVESTAAEVQVALREINVWMSCTCILMRTLPQKLNPIVKPLINYIKEGDSDIIVDLVAECLTVLLKLSADRTPSPNDKIGRKLLNLLSERRITSHELSECDGTCILSLCAEQQTCGRSQCNSVDLPTGKVNSSDGSNSSRNAGRVLAKIAGYYQDNLRSVMPFMADILFHPLKPCSAEQTAVVFHAISVAYPSLEAQIQRRTLEMHIKQCLTALRSNNCAVRHLASKCISVLAGTELIPTLNLFLPPTLSTLETSENVADCVGPLEAINCLIKKIGPHLAGVTRVLASSVLCKMTFPHAKIRLRLKFGFLSIPTFLFFRECACESFCTLVELMPLERENDSESELCPELIRRRHERAQLFSLLCNPSALPPVLVPYAVNRELRPYQRDGITWLAFLKAYSLHGILCDEMGLGKTLQTLCIIYIATSEALEKKSDVYKSLILCPKTLVSHWSSEVTKFFLDRGPLRVSMMDKDICSEDSKECNLFIASYECLRRENASIFEDTWLYCVLDEGHLIRNPKTQLFKAALSIRAKHRLILSGTPVQNSVLELWSLFEFLMPGYLGTYQQFQQRYLRPIRLSRDTKATYSDAEAGRRALETLHKQVLPFILRRKKSDVCQDLPPKIIQDYYCTLSPLQQALYEHITDAMWRKLNAATTDTAKESGIARRGLALQTVHMLRKLCSHPMLVVNQKDNDDDDDGIKQLLCRFNIASEEELCDVQLSGKMIALKELLSECGIGTFRTEDENSGGISPHRALIFCQFKSVLNLIVQLIDNGIFGIVSFLRLDGTVPASRRQEIAQRFNEDPSIDLLLLTTQVGGLGLNLIGADVVIFFDHDWNPTKDIQAMDRAHRIGQSRTLNVYRLITQGTLEEKIMEQQRFKNYMADVVIGEENKSLLSMATDQLFEMLTLESHGKTELPASSRPSNSRSKSFARNIHKDYVSWERAEYEDNLDTESSVRVN